MISSLKNIDSLKKEILLALENVKDPEIPVISVVDLGLIQKVEVKEDCSVKIFMTPTFTACPAISYMKDEIRKSVEKIEGVKNIEVLIDFSVQWNSNMITEKGKQQLKDFGLAPPPNHTGNIDIKMLSEVSCPFCNSTNTVLKSPFGGTLCRSIHYCNNCRQGFEQFKPL